MRRPSVWLGSTLLLVGCSLSSPVTPTDSRGLPIAYLGPKPTLSGTISNWKGQTGQKVVWREYGTPSAPVTLAEGTITPDGYFTITLPEGAQLQAFLTPFVASGLPPLRRSDCGQNTLRFDHVPNLTWGGLVVDLDGRTRQLDLEGVTGPGQISGMQPKYFDREFILSGQAVCTGHGYPETMVGRMHGLEGWNWMAYRSTVTDHSSLQETFTEPISGALVWTLR